jgi:catechol 2,3-dioxygenase-like lactoylglutathione lyase family enzyme
VSTTEPTTAADPCDSPYPTGGLFGGLTSSVIECADMAAMESFYGDVLALPVKLRGEGWVVFDASPGEVVLWQGAKSEVVAGFMGADVPAAAAAAQERGAAPSQICQHPGGTHFYLADPSGNIIHIGDQ